MALIVATHTIRILAQVGDSDVQNVVGEVDVAVPLEQITDQTRRPGDAANATHRLSGVDLPSILRQIADQIEATA